MSFRMGRLRDLAVRIFVLEQGQRVVSWTGHRGRGHLTTRFPRGKGDRVTSGFASKVALLRETSTKQRLGERDLPAKDGLWYKDAVIYQVHVRSFYDSTGDGN